RQEWDVPWMAAVERVVLVHRLREVVAQVGFTRFEAAAPDLQGELEMSVISLPDRDETVKQAVDKVWEFLEGVENLELLQYERRKARVNAALEGLSDEEVFAEIQSRLDLAESSPKTVKQAELETLVASKLELGVLRTDVAPAGMGRPLDAGRRACGAGPSAA
ncbi:MAG: hypothetical protein MUF25_18585, partial [Pirellulaceae bacterium]|nr:hypothetical protein [Pirellulaceae bacterium]